MKRSAKPPFVIHIFSPLSTHEPSACLAWPGARAERVRSRSGLAEAVGADELAAHDAWEIALFLFRRAEAQDRNDREPRLCAERRREAGRTAPTASPTTIDAALSSPTPPNSSGVSAPIRPSSPARATTCAPQPSSSFPSRECRRDFVGHELGRRLLDQAVLVVSRSGVRTSSGDVSRASQSPPRRVTETEDIGRGYLQFRVAIFDLRLRA